MDLWHILGLSRQTGLLAAAGGILAALALAITIAFRRRGDGRRGSLGLDDR